MARLNSLKHLFVVALGISGIVVACRATSPEAPPLAPSPDPSSPTSPVPSGPTDPGDPSSPGPNFPTEDGGGTTPTPPGPVTVREVPRPEFGADQYQLVDAGLRDANIARDVMPADAQAQPDAGRVPADAILAPVTPDASRPQ